MAALKELINAQLNADYTGQSTVAGPGATEVEISETIQEDTYLPPLILKLLQRRNCTFSNTSHKKLYQYIMSTLSSKADSLADKLMILVSYLSHNWIADSTTFYRQP